MFLNRMVDDVEFFKPSDFKCAQVVRSQILWVTLTYDAKKCSIREAWENVGKEWNRFICAMRRRYGKISVLRSWEGYKSGYPHVHAILWFESAKFSVFPHFNAKQGRFTYRINEKHEFENLWHSHIDVEAISSLKKACSYVMKYQMKVTQGKEGEAFTDDASKSGFSSSSHGSRTLAFMWLFRKRSYSVSGSFRSIFSDLIRCLRNSNHSAQVDLSGAVVNEGVWEFVGVFSGKELAINSYFWACRLNKVQIGFVLLNETRHSLTSSEERVPIGGVGEWSGGFPHESRIIEEMFK